MLRAEISRVVARDLKSLWHPFTQRKVDPTPFLFSRGQGSCLYTPEGDAYIDGISSWWVNLHGHTHPKISQAISDQCFKLDQVIFTDFTHLPAIELAEKLLQILPQGFSRVFYSDNGSTAVEIALKMALQYGNNLGLQKKKILSLQGGFHGECFGGMSLAGKSHYHAPFIDYLFPVVQLEPPWKGTEEESISHLQHILQNEDIACFIYEPLVQGAGGMRIYSQEGLQEILKLCRSAGVITIADEVMTGFGRIGPNFVSLETLVPDIICLSKGITGGFLPLGATITQEYIYEAFLSNQRQSAFLHGHSYTANPIACAAAVANIALLQKEECFLQRAEIAESHQQFCQKWQGNSYFKRLESIGTLLVAEVQGESGYFSSLGGSLRHHFFKDKIILRPLGNTIYLLPPYCISKEELNKIYCTLEKLWN